jgi:hypothetical protein
MRITELLSPFYPDEHEPIRFRGFAPKGYPKGKQPGARPYGDLWPLEFTVTRAALASSANLQQQVRECNKHRGMYFVVNAGISDAKQLPVGVYARGRDQKKNIPTQYIEDEDITRVNAFFAEGDGRSIDEQIARIEQCPLLPSMMLITLRSVHAYWLSEPGVSLEEWLRIQCGLIAYFGGDDSIKNPSRLMRLPFLNHVSYEVTTGKMSYKRVEVYKFEPTRRFTVEQMLAAFPTPETQFASTPVHDTDRGDYTTWEALGNELRRRMAAHPTAHRQGDKIVLQGICHYGKGNSALFYNTITGKYHCDNEGCTKEDILRAFGLPERPTGEHWKFKGRTTPQTARAMQFTDKQWADNPALVDFIARMKAPAVQSQTANAATASTNIESSGPPIACLDRCGDCGEFGQVFGSWCERCKSLRGFLNDPLICGHSTVRRWRYRDGGFKWHCGTCESAPGDAIWSM